MIATIVISLILAAIAAAIIGDRIKKKKKGQLGCGCGCESCSGCCDK